jgi:hypothetical protein
MSTNREIISEIRNDMKFKNLDKYVSSRYILSKLEGYASLLIRRENDQLRLWSYSDLWTTIDCFQLEPVVNKDCCGISFNNCEFLMKSINKLPDIHSYKGGLLIREVFSMDRSQKFEFTTPRNYQNILNREFQNKSLKYFWIENNYLYIPNSQIELISVTGLFKNRNKSLQTSSCQEDTLFVDSCFSILDEEFLCPDHLISTVKDMTLNSLFNSERIPRDENSNLDSNVKQGKV